MRGPRLPALLAILVVVVLGVAVVIGLDPFGAPAAPVPTAGSATPTAHTSLSTPRALFEIEASGGGPRFALEAASRPTGDVAQSKLWFHDGAWWGVLLTQESGEFRIHRFDWAGRRWLDTGTRVVPRASTHPDVLAEGDQLWIATGGGRPIPRGTLALLRYTYDTAAARYVPDHDYPVTIAIGQDGARSLTLARDDAGRLWAAWVRDGRLTVARTDGNDAMWTEAGVLPVAGADAPAEAAAMLSYGPTVALVWTHTDSDEVAIAISDTEASGTWRLVTAEIDGLRLPDDELHATVLETDSGPRLFAAVRTSLGTLEGVSRGDPQLVLLVVEPDGTSRQHLVGRIGDGHVRPIVLVDGQNGLVYVVATIAGGENGIYYKASPIDDISFGPGDGTPLMAFDELTDLDGATSTKQTLDSSTGLVVLASDGVAGSYAWSAGLLPGDGSPTRDPVSEPSVANDPLLADTFDPFTPGSTLDPMWAATSSGAATFVVEDRHGRRAAAASTTDGSSVRVCRDVAPVAEGTLRITATVMVARAVEADATITLARHAGAQSAVVRFDSAGVFSYFDGDDQVRTAVPFAPGAWYVSEVTLDLDAGTYDWQVRRESADAVILSVEGAGWRAAAAAGPVTDVCFQSPDGAGPGTSLLVDSVRVAP